MCLFPTSANVRAIENQDAVPARQPSSRPRRTNVARIDARAFNQTPAVGSPHANRHRRNASHDSALLRSMTSTEDPAVSGVVEAVPMRDLYEARIRSAIRYATGGNDTFTYPHTLLSGYEDEEVGDTAIRYLRTDAERAPYEVRIDDEGRFYYRHGGRRLDTSVTSGDGTQYFGVCTTDGRLYLCNRRREPQMRHSSFTSGGIIAAGFVLETWPGGKLRAVSHATGHYKTTNAPFKEFTRFIQSMGIREEFFAPPVSLARQVQARRAA